MQIEDVCGTFSDESDFTSHPSWREKGATIGKVEKFVAYAASENRIITQ